MKRCNARLAHKAPEEIFVRYCSAITVHDRRDGCFLRSLFFGNPRAFAVLDLVYFFDSVARYVEHWQG